MFAGKSSAIQSIVRRHKAMGWPVFVLTHSMDTRYSEEPAVVNHDKQSIPAFATDSLLPMASHAEYASSRLIIVEEAQFFSDLVPFLTMAVDKDRKNVVVVGLDGDAERRPFGKVLDLLPFCDKVTKLTSFCRFCADGTPAIFTLAYGSDASASAVAGVPCVGADEKYVPVCRKHYLEKHA